MRFDIHKFPPELRAILYSIAEIVDRDIARQDDRCIDAVLNGMSEPDHTDRVFGIEAFIQECVRREEEDTEDAIDAEFESQEDEPDMTLVVYARGDVLDERAMGALADRLKTIAGLIRQGYTSSPDMGFFID